MKRTVLSAFAILSVAGSAIAAPIALPSKPFIKFEDAEQVQPCTGVNGAVCANSISFSNLNGGTPQGNWGVILVDQIYAGKVTSTVPDNFDIGQGPAAAVFNNGGVGGNQIFGVFYGINITPNSNNLLATGGVLDLWWADSGDIDMSGTQLTPQAANGGVNPTVTQFMGGGSTGVTFLGELVFVPGANAVAGDCNTTVVSNTPISTLDGGAFSYSNINLAAGGAWAASLNNAWFQNPPCGNADVRLNTNYNLNTNWNGVGIDGVFGLNSHDPARAFGADVPEPATLTLFGLGLAGLARARRKKNQK
jgi:hypothetical protein